jgi:hypothetical protein
MENKDIKQKIIDMDMRHNVGVRYEELPTIVDKIQNIVTADHGEESWLRAMQDILYDVRMDILNIEAEKKAVAIYQKCLVCGNAAEPITLMGGRGAFYCATHRVVLPDAHISDDE